jgi:predicted O-linked N-acetylglucosamine transferase (SPINDLY family)
MTVLTQTVVSASADWADRACETALKHYHSGLVDEARQLCIRILEVMPSHGQTLYMLSLIAVNSGDATLALGLIDESLKQLPGVPFCHLLRGQILFRLRRLEEAAASVEQALRMRPAEPDALTCLANIRAAQDRSEEALLLYERSLARRPAHADTLIETGTVLRRLSRQQEAIECYRSAIALFPDNTILRNNCALAHGEIGDLQTGIEMLEQAVERAPGVIPYRFNLAQLQQAAGHYGEARGTLEDILRRDPAMTDAAIQMGPLLMQLGRSREAFAWNRQHLPLARHSPEAHAMLLMAMHYDPELTACDVWEEHCRWRQLHASPCSPRPPRRPQSGRIRLGYVSADLYRHPVGWFLRPVFEAHDRDSFDIYCYSTGIKADDLTTEFRRGSVWREAAGWGPDRLANEIRRDGIDILVDLNGFTGNNRLLAFAQRPAPVQVTWLGYPHSTGLEAIDYRITDEWADLIGRTEHLHSEKLFRLPNGFLCYGADRDSPEPAVPQGPITFGCFNSLPKINDAVIAVWARILTAVPGSMLYLRTRALTCQDSQIAVRERFAATGVDPGRLIMDGFDESHAAHLAAYNLVDIALDTFPYNGTTTTYDALWMGVPVVALEGDRHVNRVCVSILQRAGHSEWLAADPEAYVEIAVRLARNPRPPHRDRLLPPTMTDGPTFTRALENAYREMLNAIPSPVPDAETLKRKVAAKPYWYHKIDLPGGIVTPGWAPLSRDAYRVPDDLKGLRVLDVGAWDGFWTFLALQRGAREVVAIDDFSDYLGSLKDTDRHAWENFDLCREAFGYDDSRCRRIEMSVYDATEERLGRFDVIFFFGTLYHLRHPLLALDRLSAICDREIYVESAILDDFSPYRGGLGRGYPGEMVMEFYPDNQYGSNETNWWAPSLQCLVQMVRAAGFSQVTGWKLTDNPPGLPTCRGFAKGTK